MKKGKSSQYFYGEISRDGELKFYENELFKDFLHKFRGKKIVARIDRLTGQRTLTQNAALHKGFELIAEALNDAGLDMKKVLKLSVDIEWTAESVKEYLFRPVMQSLLRKDSTTELDKVEDIERVWNTLFRYLGEKHQVEYIPFPSKDLV